FASEHKLWRWGIPTTVRCHGGRADRILSAGLLRRRFRNRTPARPDAAAVLDNLFLWQRPRSAVGRCCSLDHPLAVRDSPASAEAVMAPQLLGDVAFALDCPRQCYG